jgi:S-adenosyl-L-methionine hydrolase (adenosine-forming)
MSIITLTTDFGLKDPYAAVLKGRLLSLCPQAVVVDISHQIPPYDLAQAAWVVRKAYREFPENTIHLIAVGSTLSTRYPHIAFELHGHRFIGCDNGLFSLLSDERPESIAEIATGENTETTFVARDIYAPIAARLVKGEPISTLGPYRESIFEKLTRRHPPEENVLKGTIAYVDAFGNLITDITRNQFEKMRQGRSFTIELIGDEIDILHKRYTDVVEGEKLALFNASGVLEIAINQGKASSLLNLKLYDVVRIVFV